MIVGSFLQRLESLLQALLELLQQLLARLPVRRLELRSTRRIDVDLIHIHDHVDPAGSGCDNRCEGAERHRLVVRLPVILALGNILERFTDTNGFVIEFGGEQIGDFCHATLDANRNFRGNSSDEVRLKIRVPRVSRLSRPGVFDLTATSPSLPILDREIATVRADSNTPNISSTAHEKPQVS